jgi:phosphohistidine phosphatase SixA
MRVYILILLIVCSCFGSINASGNDSSYTLYLVRHAEKQVDGGKDPALTEQGKHRSEQLAAWFLDKDINEVWSSDYKRTRDTAGPLLSALDLNLTHYDPRKLPVLVKKLQASRNNAVVVGHSNTTPELAGLLCECVIPDMDESEYDRLIVVTVIDGVSRVESLTQNTLFQP